MSSGKIILTVLIGILLFMGLVSFLVNRAGHTPTLFTSQSPKKNTTPEDYNKDRVYIAYKGNLGRNPFKSPFDAAPVPKKTPQVSNNKINYTSLDNIKLQGIIIAPTGPKAIINDQLLGEGDSIEGVKITTIKETYVILKYRGKTVKKVLE